MTNLQNSRLESWDYDNHMQRKTRKIMRLNYQSIQFWGVELIKKLIKKRTKTNNLE